MRLSRLRSNLLVGLFGISCSGGDPISGSVNPPPPPPPPPAAADLVLHTTLDGPVAVMSPTLGSGSGAVISTSPANDFVSAKYGDGLRTNAIGERIQFPQTNAGIQNVELERGTLEFWYRPNYKHDNNLKYTIAGTGNWPGAAGRGSLHLGKHNDTNHNRIFLIFFDANGVRWEHGVAVTDYSWNAGDWLLVRLTWDFGVPAGEPNLHLYLNGTELQLTGQVARGPQPIPAERTDEKIYIGSRDLTGTIIADGIYDEVRLWKQVIPPS